MYNFRGGVTYSELMEMPFPDINGLHAQASRIQAKIKITTGK